MYGLRQPACPVLESNSASTRVCFSMIQKATPALDKEMSGRSLYIVRVPKSWSMLRRYPNQSHRQEKGPYCPWQSTLQVLFFLKCHWNPTCFCFKRIPSWTSMKESHLDISLVVYILGMCNQFPLTFYPLGSEFKPPFRCQSAKPSIKSLRSHGVHQYLKR